jgi:fido (protein-threonine AMPylation protein)
MQCSKRVQRGSFRGGGVHHIKLVQQRFRASSRTVQSFMAASATDTSRWCAKLTTGYVIWDTRERKEQIKHWNALAGSCHDMIADVGRCDRADVDAFLHQQIALFIFDANRLEGTISAKHAQGPTMKLILSFLDKSSPEPERTPWDSEGGREPGTPSSDRQLFQAVHAATFLLNEHRSNALTVSLITETHRIMTQGSYLNDAQTPLAAGVLRRSDEDKVYAGSHQFMEPKFVERAVIQLCEEYETRRSNREHPVALATFLFYGLITIHPFMNGNGRLCRFMLAWSLMRDGFPFPVTLAASHGETRRHYLHAIEQARGRRYRAGNTSFAELNVTALDSMTRVVNNFLENEALSGKPLADAST